LKIVVMMKILGMRVIRILGVIVRVWK